MDDLELDGFTIPAAELDESFDTSGGPGGQHANRNETAVRLRFDIKSSSLPDSIKATLISRLGDRIEVISSDHRSQLRNRESARERLASKLEDALVQPKPRKRTKPTRASKERRIAGKKARSSKKQNRRPPAIED
ncbi:MAG: alternative ribosome rescue aminoacyl-tRNA hydrolase ArfB [Acidimicrobiia bacterium]